MCGIAGIFGPGTMGETLDRMVRAQRHRGPDAEGVWISPSGSAGLGHNRLSIIDLSPAGGQPMWSDRRRSTIVFNGEIYNYIELRSELGDYPYRSQSDTEVILAAYERWGVEASLERFTGMFAFLLWDDTDKTLVATRDRFGVKPL
jgi:asparagine synthase (glutamine-hydrolysing)